MLDLPPFSADVFVSNAGEEEVTMVTNNLCVTHRMRMPYAQLGSVGNPSAESPRVAGYDLNGKILANLESSICFDTLEFYMFGMFGYMSYSYTYAYVKLVVMKYTPASALFVLQRYMYSYSQ